MPARPFLTLTLLTLAAPAAAGLQTFDCIILPSVMVEVGSPVPGLLARVEVDQGDMLTKDQVIARLHSEVEEKSVELLAVQAESTAEIEAQESRLALSKKRLARAQEMRQRNVGTAEALEAAEAESEVIARELAIARMRQSVARLELERGKTQLEQRVIRSPIDGVVIARKRYDGEFLGTEDSVATIARIDPLRVEAFLPVALYPALHTGMTLKIRPDAPFEGVHEASIDVIDRVFDAASGTFGIRLTLPNAEGAIPAGHRCTTELDVPGE